MGKRQHVKKVFRDFDLENEVKVHKWRKCFISHISGNSQRKIQKFRVPRTAPAHKCLQGVKKGNGSPITSMRS